MTFLVNETDIDMMKGGFMKPCPNQLACMRNVTRIQMKTSKKNLQLGLEQLFLSYQGKPDYWGPDVLRFAPASPHTQYWFHLSRQALITTVST